MNSPNLVPDLISQMLQYNKNILKIGNLEILQAQGDIFES